MPISRGCRGRFHAWFRLRARSTEPLIMPSATTCSYPNLLCISERWRTRTAQSAPLTGNHRVAFDIDARAANVVATKIESYDNGMVRRLLQIPATNLCAERKAKAMVIVMSRAKTGTRRDRWAARRHGSADPGHARRGRLLGFTLFRATCSTPTCATSPSAGATRRRSTPILPRRTWRRSIGYWQ